MKNFILFKKTVPENVQVRLLAFLFFLFVFLPSFAQSPEGISYQAVVRDNANKPLPDTKVNMRFSILQGSADGTVVYTETQALTTNSLGLVTAGIGTGTVVSGDFSAIDWSAGPYFLKVEADPSGGSDYTLTGTLQILSVPYALYAKKAGNVFSGDYNDLANAPVNVSAFNNDAGYLTSEKDGDPANELQTLSISNDTLSLSNGGAVVLPPDQDSDPTNELQTLSISDDTLSLTNGGSVVLPPDEDFQKTGHFVTTLDSVGIGTQNPHSILEVHGRITQTGTKKSVIIGEGAGSKIEISDDYQPNVLIGTEAGHSLLSGQHNIAVGHSALYSNMTGSGNVAVGNHALSFNTADNNTANGNQTLYQNTTGHENTAVGFQALYANTTGYHNTALGNESLKSNRMARDNTAVGYRSLSDNSYGSYNTALGSDALKSNTSASSNTAVGCQSLYANTTGSGNTATGHHALYSNTTGSRNIALGYFALALNTTGNRNTATGYYALVHNTTGHDNTAIGNWALYNNSGGSSNTAVGIYSLYNNIGNYNTAVGDSALYSNRSGMTNTAIGNKALVANSTGYGNTAIGNSTLAHNLVSIGNTAMGDGALYYYGDLNASHGYNTAVGEYALAWLKTGTQNTAIGYDAGVGAYSNNTNIYNSTALGNGAYITASNQVRIGNNYVTSIGGYAGWSNLSDGRFKTEVKSGVPGLAFILKLRPVMYRLNVDKLNSFLQVSAELSKESDSQAAQMVRTGFIAQEVEKVAQEMGYDFSGIDKPKNEHDYYSLRYAEFVVPLVKAIQEQQAEIEALKEQNRLLQQQIDELKNRN